MKRPLLLIECVVIACAFGCDLSPDASVRTPPPPVVDSGPAPRTERVARRIEQSPELSFDTPRDQRFGEFVSKTAGGMVRKVAVGIERRGTMRVVLDRSTAPEDTLPLTKSLMAGARKDFPATPITLSVYDPEGSPILKAHYHPDHGVRYEVAHDNDGGRSESGRSNANRNRPEVDERAPSAEHWQSSKAWSGTTANDRKFAEWAYGRGHKFLRYVQADLERSGRLWFGVTSNVRPDEVSELTKSLLQGARTEFPLRRLTAKVFDPEGEAIGNATLGADGQIHWAQVPGSN